MYIKLNVYYILETLEIPVDVCQPSPCGPNSRCQEVNKQAVCSCMPNYIGSPPGCRPECVVSSDCPSNKACANEKCIDPCTNACGSNADCRVINHNPICNCKNFYTGDPFSRCIPLKRKLFLICHSSQKHSSNIYFSLNFLLKTMFKD